MDRLYRREKAGTHITGFLSNNSNRENEVLTASFFLCILTGRKGSSCSVRKLRQTGDTGGGYDAVKPAAACGLFLQHAPRGKIERLLKKAGIRLLTEK